MSLAYWVQYVNKFDSGHMLPLYVGQSNMRYYNLDIWCSLFFGIFMAVCLFNCFSSSGDDESGHGTATDAKVKTD